MNQQDDELSKRIAQKLNDYADKKSLVNECDDRLKELWDYLKESEELLIKLMNGDHPQGNMGNLETGPALYLLNSAKFLSFLKKPPYCLPETHITDKMIESWNDKLKGNGVVYNDGTIYSYDKYCQFDKGWYIVSLAWYIGLKIGVNSLYKPFPNSPKIIPISNKDSITIAIVGDWGTGFYKDGAVDCPAQLVKNSIDRIGADYNIHLGDVYYAGTDNWGDLIHGEEQKNFVNVWPSGKSGSFTLNSNHEMYDGANGLFNVALGKPGESLFSLQKGNSFFAITYENWVIIGLDSGYYDKSSLFMEGSIGDPVNGEQAKFIKKLNLEGKQVIVMTHHVGIQFDGTAVPVSKKQPITLWDEVAIALGQGNGKRYPDYWYYGHIHNGVAYNEDAPGVQGFKTPSDKAPLMRCNGHGALPFGKGYGLLTSDGKLKLGADYMSHTKMPNPNSKQGNRVLNGFATITLSQREIIEKFYEVESGKEASMKWTKTTNF